MEWIEFQIGDGYANIFEYTFRDTNVLSVYNTRTLRNISYSVDQYMEQTTKPYSLDLVVDAREYIDAINELVTKKLNR